VSVPINTIVGEPIPDGALEEAHRPGSAGADSLAKRLSANATDIPQPPFIEIAKKPAFPQQSALEALPRWPLLSIFCSASHCVADRL
jgi:hypothetical protein